MSDKPIAGHVWRGKESCSTPMSIVILDSRPKDATVQIMCDDPKHPAHLKVEDWNLDYLRMYASPPAYEREDNDAQR